MKIGIVGLGYVGLTQMILLANKGHNIYGVDKDQNKIDLLNSGEQYIYEKDFSTFMEKNSERLHFLKDLSDVINELEIIFVCVNTPERKNGECNTDLLFAAIHQLANIISDKTIVVIKSTIEVGTSRKIQNIIKNPIVICPEFLAQGSALENALHPDRIIIGGENPDALEKVKTVCVDGNMECVVTNWETAEMIKNASNVFLAAKISLIDELSRLCGKIGANILDVSRGVGLDHRIGSYFLNPGTGFGGSCFKKDTLSVCSMAKKNDLKLEFIESINKSNEYQKCLAYKLAEKIYDNLGSKTCSILGLSFKKGTNDCRNSSSLDIVHSLLESGTNIKLYDPVAKNSFLYEYNMTYGVDLEDDLFYSDVKMALKDSDLCIIMTDWDEITNLAENDFLDYMSNPIVIDGRYCLTQKLKDSKVDIYPINYNLDDVLRKFYSRNYYCIRFKESRPCEFCRNNQSKSESIY